MREAEELHEPTEEYYAQPLEVSNFLLSVAKCLSRYKF